MEIADVAYFKMSVVRPSSAVARGYSNPMPSYEGQLNAEDLDALWAYVACLSEVEPRGGCADVEP